MSVITRSLEISMSGKTDIENITMPVEQALGTTYGLVKEGRFDSLLQSACGRHFSLKEIRLLRTLPLRET